MQKYLFCTILQTLRAILTKRNKYLDRDKCKSLLVGIEQKLQLCKRNKIKRIRPFRYITNCYYLLYFLIMLVDFPAVPVIVSQFRLDYQLLGAA